MSAGVRACYRSADCDGIGKIMARRLLGEKAWCFSVQNINGVLRHPSYRMAQKHLASAKTTRRLNCCTVYTARTLAAVTHLRSDRRHTTRRRRVQRAGVRHLPRARSHLLRSPLYIWPSAGAWALALKRCRAFDIVAAGRRRVTVSRIAAGDMRLYAQHGENVSTLKAAAASVRWTCRTWCGCNSTTWWRWRVAGHAAVYMPGFSGEGWRPSLRGVYADRPSTLFGTLGGDIRHNGSA